MISAKLLPQGGNNWRKKKKADTPLRAQTLAEVFRSASLETLLTPAAITFPGITANLICSKCIAEGQAGEYAEMHTNNAHSILQDFRQQLRQLHASSNLLRTRRPTAVCCRR